MEGSEIQEEVQQQTNGSDTNLDIADLIEQVSRGIELTQKRNQRSTLLISRVDEFVRVVDPHKYSLSHVSIGPYHYKMNAEKDIIREEDKCAILASIFSGRRGESIPADEKKLTRCMIYLNRWDAYTYYDLSNTKFSHGKDINLLRKTVLFDSCYVLEWFASKQIPREGTDPDELVKVERDVLYLLENQLPFTLLEEINTAAEWCSAPLVKVFGDYIIKRVLQRYKHAYVKVVRNEADNPPDDNAVPEPVHLLHLLYLYFTGKVLAIAVDNKASSSSTASGPAGENNATASQNLPLGNKELYPFTDRSNDEALGDHHSDQDILRWRRATEYHKANVKFKPRELTETEGRRSVLDVELRDSTLMMPCLVIDQYTWSILRNLMALEQQKQHCLGFRVTAYCTFLSEVAGTAEDVEFLSESGVITHMMADHATCAEYFAKLRNGVTFGKKDKQENYLLGTCLQLAEQVDSMWSGWMASLWHDYFDNPWKIAGVVVATILLVCAILQTAFTVKGYYKQK